MSNSLELKAIREDIVATHETEEGLNLADKELFAVVGGAKAAGCGYLLYTAYTTISDYVAKYLM